MRVIQWVSLSNSQVFHSGYTGLPFRSIPEIPGILVAKGTIPCGPAQGERRLGCEPGALLGWVLSSVHVLHVLLDVVKQRFTSIFKHLHCISEGIFRIIIESINQILCINLSRIDVGVFYFADSLWNGSFQKMYRYILFIYTHGMRYLMLSPVADD